MNGHSLLVSFLRGLTGIPRSALHDTQSLRRGRRLLPWLALASMAVLAGCGGSSDVFSPTPTGQFSNASLQGSYAFEFSGNDFSGFYSVAGSFQADGNGTITGGSMDLASVSGIFTNAPISGNYSITADGRGTAIFNSGVNPLQVAFVVLSSQRALVVRFDNFANGSGSIDRQNAAAFSTSALQGQFAFTVSGIDNIGNVFASGGNFQADNAGNLTGGTQDFNDDGTLTTNLALSGLWNVGPANGRGSATLTTSAGTMTFAFYVVDANHVKMVETDGSTILGGDGFRQTGAFSNASLNGAFPYTLGGISSTGVFVAGGIFNVNGSGSVTGGVEDVNNNGNVVESLSLSGSYSIAANGRGTLVLTNPTGTSNFVVYPTSGGLLMLETDLVIVSTGSAFQQSGSFSNSTVQGNYGLNFSGVQLGGEIDLVSQFNATGSGSLTGTQDVNNSGGLFQGLALSGSYSVSSNGRGTATLQTSAGTINLVFYAVNGSQALFIDVDPSLPAAGEFDVQP